MYIAFMSLILLKRICKYFALSRKISRKEESKLSYQKIQLLHFLIPYFTYYFVIFTFFTGMFRKFPNEFKNLL